MQMMRLVFGLAILLAVMWTATESFAQQKKDYAVWGLGSISCAEFGKMYGGDPDYAEKMYFSWAQGFMSALNVTRITKGLKSVNLALWDIERDQQHIRNYCADQPLKDYLDAVVELFGELMAAQGLAQTPSPQH